MTTTKKFRFERSTPKRIKNHIRGKHENRPFSDCMFCLIPQEDVDEITLEVLKSSTKAATSSGSDIVTDAMIERWKTGYPMNDLASEAGIKRNKFRREMMKAVGGRAAFKALRAEGAGGHLRAIPRAGSDAPAANISDDGVKTIKGARYVDGWKSRILYVGPKKESTSISVFISPDGTEYVRAKSNEKADLIYKPKGAKASGLPVVRLRKFETSSIGRKHSKEEALVERGEDALKRDREAKKAKRSRKAKDLVEPAVDDMSTEAALERRAIRESKKSKTKKRSIKRGR